MVIEHGGVATRHSKMFFQIVFFLGGVGFAYLAFLFSPFHGPPFPFGSGLASAFLCLALLGLWAGVRFQNQRERRAIRYGLSVGLICGFVGLVAGVLWGVFWSKGNLAPIVGFFQTGPYGFAGGTIAGISYGFARRGKKAVADVV
jgi:hypothetical protein